MELRRRPKQTQMPRHRTQMKLRRLQKKQCLGRVLIQLRIRNDCFAFYTNIFALCLHVFLIEWQISSTGDGTGEAAKTKPKKASKNAPQKGAESRYSFPFNYEFVMTYFLFTLTLALCFFPCVSHLMTNYVMHSTMDKTADGNAKKQKKSKAKSSTNAPKGKEGEGEEAESRYSFLFNYVFHSITNS